MLRSPLAALLVLPCILLSSCVETHLSYASANFAPNTLLTRGVAVGSLADSLPEKLSHLEKKRLVEELAQKLDSSAKVSYTSSHSSSDPYRLDPKIKRTFVQSWISDDCRTEREPIYDCKGKITGYVETTHYSTSANVSRLVDAEFQLFDPRTGELMWAWSGSHTETNTRTNESCHGYPAPPPYPRPPSAQQVADNLMRASVRKLNQTAKAAKNSRNRDVL